jgi:hypothetical protein
MEDLEYRMRRREFLDSMDFRRFVIPLMAERREDLVRSLVDKGGEDTRFRIKELDDLHDLFEKIANEKEVPDPSQN